MKIKTIARQIISEAAVPPQFKKLFAAYPRDAKSWKDADDVMRDVARLVRETYNEIDLDLTSSEVEDGGKGIQSLNFRSFKTPAEWNSKSQDFIVKVWPKLGSESKSHVIKQLNGMFPEYF